MLGEDAVTGEHTKEALEVFGVAAGGEDTCEDLGGGEGSVGARLPDGVGNVEADDGVEGHGDANHVGEFQNGQPRLLSRFR